MRPFIRHDCGAMMVKVNGGSLRDYLNANPRTPEFRVRRANQTRWIDLCPSCSSTLLEGVQHGPEMPFLCSDHRMRTLGDIRPGTDMEPEQPLSFARFEMSKRALSAAMVIMMQVDGSTPLVEKLGSNLIRVACPIRATAFSRRVCFWGRGGRVWANLVRDRDLQVLGADLSAWLQNALQTEDPKVALLPGVAIKGLGVSFASKHLRMLAPNYFPVLDGVLSEGLGFALNPAGYSLFVKNLREFADDNALLASLASIEAGLFFLVRQHVRAN